METYIGNGYDRKYICLCVCIKTGQTVTRR